MDVSYRVHLQWYSCPSRPLFEHCHHGNRSLMPCTLSGLLYLNSFLVFSTKPFTEPQLIQDSVRGEVFAWWVGFFCLHYRVSSKWFSLPLIPSDRLYLTHTSSVPGSKILWLYLSPNGFYSFYSLPPAPQGTQFSMKIPLIQQQLFHFDFSCLESACIYIRCACKFSLEHSQVRGRKGYISVIPTVYQFQMHMESKILCLQIPNIRILLGNREQEGSWEVSMLHYANERRQTWV